MRVLNSVSCGDNYTDAATIVPVFNSNGGTFNVTSADAFMQLAYIPDLGDNPKSQNWAWTQEFRVPVGNTGAVGSLQPGTVGVRFRNYVAGSVATIGATLAGPLEPSILVSSSGISANTVTGTVTGIIPAAGTTPTSGTGFTYTHTNGTGVYVFTFSTPFAATPLVLLTIGPEAGIATRIAVVTASATTGFTVETGAGNSAADHPFMFTAQVVN